MKPEDARDGSLLIKKGKNKGTKTLVVSGNLSNVGSDIDYAGSQVILKSNPLTRPYARIHQEWNDQPQGKYSSTQN